MGETMLDYFKLAVPHIAPALISAESIEKMRRIASLFPPVMGLDLECRMGSPAPQADFLLRVLPTDPLRAALLGDGDPRLPEVLRGHPVWKDLTALVRRWEESESLRATLQDIFLEFDMVERTQSEIPIPCCFLDFHPARESRLAELDQALPILLGAPRWAAIRANVERCLSLLPPGAQVPSIGWMLPRGMEGVRFYVVGSDFDGWLEYLERIGWPGSIRGVDAAMREIVGMADRVDLDLDVGAEVGPKIGFELQVDKGIWKGKARWARILDWLVERGSVLPEKRDAALSFTGYTHERAEPDAWPPRLRRLSAELGDQVMSVLTRRIGHMKLIYVPNGPPEAKVYLEFMHRWLRYSDDAGRYVMDDRDHRIWND